jgi:nucleoside 2-deoxyribosyltransferase
MRRVYIAGPDLFYRASWSSHVAHVADLCAAHDITPCFPIAGEPASGAGVTEPGTPDDAAAIYRSCMDLIRSCDGVIANVNPFRGFEPDSGTVFEIATARSVGLPVVGYRAPQAPRRGAFSPRPDGSFVYADGSFCEQFGFPGHLNVMVAMSLDVIESNVEGAVREMARYFRALTRSTATV